MAALPPAQERRRPRRGSVERPVNGRLYRGAWLVVGLPLLVLAFSVARPSALQPPNLPAGFDAGAATALAADLAGRWPTREAGTAADEAAGRWVADALRSLGYHVERERFTAALPGRGRVPLVNLLALRPGRSPKTIVVMAHRDTRAGPGRLDAASGTATVLELARAYAPVSTPAATSLPYTLAFLSTDGAAPGGLGAAYFAAHAPKMRDVIAVVNVGDVAGTAPPRLVLTGDTPRSPNPSFVETIRSQLAAQTGREPGRVALLEQLVDLGFPFSRFEQAPFVSRGVPAVTITTAPDRPDAGRPAGPALRIRRLGQVGGATQNAVDALQQGVALSAGPPSYLYLGPRIVRGWAIELVLIGALVPFLAATVDLFARCRRRRIPIAPALRSYRSRLAFWAWCGLLLALFALTGAWGSGPARPPDPNGVDWPAGALVGVGTLAGLGWLVARDRLVPRRPVLAEEELAGHTGALLALAVVALLVVATNPFALLFLLPSLHAWLWLPQLRRRAAWARAAVLAAGFAGPALLVWSFAARYGLGWDAPWYLVRLFAVGYAPPVLAAIALGWAAVAAQLAALVGGRYAPYPPAAERRPRGPIRELVRTLVLAQRRRRRLAETPRRVLEH